jgi:DNA-binding NarL/FixJ family response regulator
MLVDEDPVFRLGLRIWLEQTAGYAVVAEATQADDALAILASRASLETRSDGSPDWTPQPAPDWADDWATEDPSRRPDIDLVILDLGLGAGRPDQLPGLRLCADIKARYPTLPVLVLSAQTEPVLAAATRQLGADGFGARSMAVADLGRLIEQLVAPRPQLARDLRPIASGQRPSPVTLREDRPGVPAPRPNALAALRIRTRLSSVQQIEAVMAQIEAEQRRGRGSLLSEAVLAGRYRELRAARWLVRRLLATPNFSDQGSPMDRPARPPLGWGELAPARQSKVPSSLVRRGNPESGPGDVGAISGRIIARIDTADRLALNQGDLATLVFERVFRKLQGLLDNTSDVPLESDILRDDKKRELLYLVLRKVEDALAYLREAQVLPGQLPEKSSLVLQDLWQATVTDFFGRYYSLQVDTLEQPVVPTLLTEAPVVQAAILDRLPLVPMLLGHLLFNESIVVDGSFYQAAAPEAMARSQELLEHLVIQLANAVVQPLLNHFADVELMKKNLYHRRMMTSRDIERFRNDLSWRYRWDGLINEPRAIFESQHRLFGFTERGIQHQTIYAPRREELEQLSGLQRAVTLAVEARDAIAPRFRSAVSLVGSGIVYVLTDVIGRGIGLIGRGILRGVGGAWRDPRYRRDAQESNLRD